jgi:hypothetical protein
MIISPVYRRTKWRMSHYRMFTVEYRLGASQIHGLIYLLLLPLFPMV